MLIILPLLLIMQIIMPFINMTLTYLYNKHLIIFHRPIINLNASFHKKFRTRKMNRILSIIYQKKKKVLLLKEIEIQAILLAARTRNIQVLSNQDLNTYKNLWISKINKQDNKILMLQINQHPQNQINLSSKKRLHKYILKFLAIQKNRYKANVKHYLRIITIHQTLNILYDQTIQLSKKMVRVLQNLKLIKFNNQLLRFSQIIKKNQIKENLQLFFLVKHNKLMFSNLNPQQNSIVGNIQTSKIQENWPITLTQNKLVFKKEQQMQNHLILMIKALLLFLKKKNSNSIKIFSKVHLPTEKELLAIWALKCLKNRKKMFKQIYRNQIFKLLILIQVQFIKRFLKTLSRSQLLIQLKQKEIYFQAIKIIKSIR
ncbi:transmembrane protein, putative (macronuclear) [Tetrahymena thermophila SB210]|uniref:Transmembrane protein, putative n=1 Tax=Tetrahymena thermophila (strain SB210) TaxID=312017 RepID=W7XH04_TETTS|nr:transmembrane protein, putative [Tetrahymena thermophila SB210]EWS73576.1 transmembrane protein, putative [Tetrahymena thermophila SB210]|eukprot:XP_012653899.1 transmembrane protein, putative [Tetrahymena thermophila SB210]